MEHLVSLPRNDSKQTDFAAFGAEKVLSQSKGLGVPETGCARDNYWG